MHCDSDVMLMYQSLLFMYPYLNFLGMDSESHPIREEGSLIFFHQGSKSEAIYLPIKGL